MLHEHLQRWRAGDPAGANELIRKVGNRLEQLTRKMCKAFPNVRVWAESSDVLQGSLMRLLRTLQTIEPIHTKAFYNLAAVHIRRELLDLARHFRGKLMVSLNTDPSTCDPNPHQLPDPVSPEIADLDQWTRFHQAVDQLPEEEKEVVDCVYYHGMKKVQAAAFLGVDERTIRRRWELAIDRIRNLIGVLSTPS